MSYCNCGKPIEYHAAEDGEGLWGEHNRWDKAMEELDRKYPDGIPAAELARMLEWSCRLAGY